MWAMALAAGGRIDQTTPYVLFVVGAFGPTLVAAALCSRAGAVRVAADRSATCTGGCLPPCCSVRRPR